MIHHLYVGHFEKVDGSMKLEASRCDGAPRAVVVRPLHSATIHDLLAEKGLVETSIPEDWRLGIEKEGIIVCEAYGGNPDAMDFIRKLAKRTGCDVLYDGIMAVSPEELGAVGQPTRSSVTVPPPDRQ